ncbi:sialic acid synthase [Staphylococcus sp. GSSP0090]|nr:sialic acid synthase [Staphylococcus sp. GSSP0090]
MNTKRNDNNLIDKLTNDEQYALSYIQSVHPAWAEAFNSILLESRDKISQRLITSMHRENLVNCRDYSEIIDINQLPFSIDTPHTNVLKISFPQAQRQLYAPILGQHAFDRINVTGPFYFAQNNEYDRVLHPSEVLSCILLEAPHLDNKASMQFKEDMDNSVANMAIALSYQAYTLTDYNEPLCELIFSSDDPYLRSEQAVVEGHPLHPGAKLRKGMTPETAIAYSSEFANNIKMQFILIHKKIAKAQTLNNDYNESVYKCFNGLRDAAVSSLSNDDVNHYYAMAVHPWQYDEILKQDYIHEIEQGLIIPIDYELDYFAGLSFRTLMPKLPETLPHIKLSTNVHITGEIRTLSEQTTINGPQVTKILNDIKDKDHLFHNIMADTIDELAGIHFYNSQDAQSLQTIKSEQLGTLFRENIYNIIQSNTTPMIPSSLVANYINHSEMPIWTLIKKYAEAHQLENYEEASMAWMHAYAKALIDLALPLYVKYGIALEAHLQNSIVTFKHDSSIDKMYIRDFEGLRIDEKYLNSMGYATDTFHEKSLILTDQSQTVFNKVFYSSIQNHLGELIVAIAQSSESKTLESLIWSMISQILHEKLHEISQTMDNSSRIKSIESILFASKIDYKCVTTMRLEDEADYYTYIKVDNPLYRPEA